MNLEEIISQEKLNKYKLDEYEDNYCFVQVDPQKGFIEDKAVLVWDGYFDEHFLDYLVKKQDSGIIAAMDEALFPDEHEEWKSIGYVTNLDREIRYLKEGANEIRNAMEWSTNPEEARELVDNVRLELIELFQDALEKGNKVSLFMDWEVAYAEDNVELE